MRRFAFALLALFATGPALATPPPIMASPQAGVSPESDAKVGRLPTAAPGTVTITGLNGRQEVLTAAEVAKLPREHVAVSHTGVTADYSGPLVADLLRDVGAPMGVRLHGAGVNDVVFVTGADKFRAVFSLAELDPEFHKGARAILADQADGKPLPTKQGPYRLIVEGDLKPARSVYAVVSMELKHLP